MNEQIVPVSGNQKIAFQCQRCGACCRHVENKVMLEPYDVYLLALHFKAKGKPSGRKISAHNMRTPCRWNRISRFSC